MVGGAIKHIYSQYIFTFIIGYRYQWNVPRGRSPLQYALYLYFPGRYQLFYFYNLILQLNVISITMNKVTVHPYHQCMLCAQFV